MTHHPHRARGLITTPAANVDEATRVLAELQLAAKANNDRHHTDITEIRAQLGDMATALASIDANGGGGDITAKPAAMRVLSGALRSYVGSGNLADLKTLVRPVAGMSVGSDPEGGYTVVPTLAREIAQVVFESSPIRQIARHVSVSTGSWRELVSKDEPAASWVGETDSRAETDAPDLALLEFPVHEVYANPALTQTLLDDSEIDLAGWIVEQVGAKFGRTESTAFVNGSGVAQPRGFLQYDKIADANYAWSNIGYIASGAASNFASSNPGDALFDVVSSLKGEYRQNARWVMNRRTAGVIRKFKDGDGNYLWQNSLIAGQPEMLLGYPVVLADDMPDVDAGTFPIAFGDFGRGYTVVDRHGIRVLRDPFTSKPNVLFYCYTRVGGGVSNFEAIKLLKIAAS